MSNNYTSVALGKINDLIKRKDFLSIIFIGPHFMMIEFDKKICDVSNFGNTTWDNKK